MDTNMIKVSDTETIGFTLAVKVMGYEKKGDLYVKSGEYPIIIREFKPLGNLPQAFKVLTSVTTEQYKRDCYISYEMKSNGIGHHCLIYNDRLQRAGSATALTPEMAICMAVFDYCDIQTDYEDATEKELYPRKEAV